MTAATKHNGINATRDVLKDQAGEHAALVEWCASKLRKSGYVTLPRALDETAGFIEQLEADNDALRDQLPRPGGIIVCPVLEPSLWPTPIACVIGFALGMFAGVVL